MDQSNSEYTVQGNQLIIENIVIPFDFPIAQVIEIAGMLVLRLDIPTRVTYNENVFGISLAVKIIKWQIVNRGYSDKRCPFTYIRIFENELELINWCSIYFIVNPLTGEILKDGFTK
jgi:hypothetical protein